MWCKEHWVSGDEDPDPVLLLNSTGSDWATPIHSQASFAPPVLFRVGEQGVCGSWGSSIALPKSSLRNFQKGQLPLPLGAPSGDHLTIIAKAWGKGHSCPPRLPLSRSQDPPLSFTSTFHSLPRVRHPLGQRPRTYHLLHSHPGLLPRPRFGP